MKTGSWRAHVSSSNMEWRSDHHLSRREVYHHCCHGGDSLRLPYTGIIFWWLVQLSYGCAVMEQSANSGGMCRATRYVASRMYIQTALNCTYDRTSLSAISRRDLRVWVNKTDGAKNWVQVGKMPSRPSAVKFYSRTSETCEYIQLFPQWCGLLITAKRLRSLHIISPGLEMVLYNLSPQRADYVIPCQDLVPRISWLCTSCRNLNQL